MSKKTGSKYLNKHRYVYGNFTDWNTKAFKKNGNKFEKINRQKGKKEVRDETTENEACDDGNR